MSRALKPSYAPPKSPVEDEVEGTVWEQVTASIGAEAASQLSKHFGGRRIYIRREPGAHHPLSAAIGQPLAKILGEAHHGRYVDVPLTKVTRERILELRRQDVQVSRIAQMLRCTERRVWQVLAEAKAAGETVSNQPDMWA